MKEKSIKDADLKNNKRDRLRSGRKKRAKPSRNPQSFDKSNTNPQPQPEQSIMDKPPNIETEPKEEGINPLHKL